jgi:hypothetical protein
MTSPSMSATDDDDPILNDGDASHQFIRSNKHPGRPSSSNSLNGATGKYAFDRLPGAAPSSEDTNFAENNEEENGNGPGKVHQMHPEVAINPLIRPLLTWIYPLIRTAAAGNITERDIWDCPNDANVVTNTARIQTAWREELELMKTEYASEDYLTKNNFILNYLHGKWLRIPPFGRAILRAYYGDVAMSGLYQLCFAAMQLTIPFLIGNVIAYLNERNSSSSIERGIGMVFALGIVSTVSSYAILLTFYSTRRTGVCIKAGVMMATYQHALHLSVAARHSCSVGQTTNLMSIDSDKIVLASQYLHFLW